MADSETNLKTWRDIGTLILFLEFVLHLRIALFCCQRKTYTATLCAVRNL
jgi:hypothetical protein